MTDRNFVVKNGLQVNSVFTVDSAAGIVTVTGNAAIGANVILTIQDITIGNSTVNAVLNATSISVGNTSVNVSINSTSFSGTANNALNLTGAINLGNSTVNAIVNSTTVLMSANMSVNSTTVSVGNSTVNLVANSSKILIGGNLSVTSSLLSVGNATINLTMNSSTLVYGGNLQINSTVFQVGNGTVFATMNSTVFSGTTLIANNASFLGGVAAASYLTTSGTAADSSKLGGVAAGSYLTTTTAASTYLGISATAADSSKLGGTVAASYQLNSTLAANVAKLDANNASFLGGTAAASYLTTSSSGLASISVNITTSANVQGVYVKGTTDVWAGSSDARVKDVVNEIDGAEAIEILSSLTAYRYTLKKDIPNMPTDDLVRLGLMVQDIEPVLPEVIAPAPFDTDIDGNSISGMNYKTLQYEKIVPVLVAAINNLNAEILELKKRIG